MRRSGAARLWVWTFVCALLVGGAGCVVGPDYKPPRVRVNGAWSNGGDPRVSPASISATWWRTFSDPALDRLVELAVRQNLPLQVAGLRILEARAALGIANAQQYPTNGPIGSAQGVGLKNDQLNLLYGVYQVGFDALWEPDFWGKYRRGIRAARAGYLATVAEYDDALVSLTAEVARTYLLVRTYQVELALARENVDLQTEGLRIAESRARNGATSELDVAQATQLLESTRATIPELVLAVRTSENALCTLLGRTTGCTGGLLDGPEAIPAPPPRVALGLPIQLLRRRPDVRAAELAAMAQCDRIGIAKADLFPSLNLFGSVGTRTVNGTGAPANLGSLLGLFSAGSLFYTFGANLIWPILSYPRILNNVRVEDARFQAALLQYQHTVIRAQQEVEDGLNGFLREQESAVSADKAVAAAQDGVHLALVQYREGAVDYQRVLDTQRVLLQSQNTLVRTRSSIATDLVALYKALGGGWELREGQPIMTEATRIEMKRRSNWGHYLETPYR